MNMFYFTYIFYGTTCKEQSFLSYCPEFLFCKHVLENFVSQILLTNIVNFFVSLFKVCSIRYIFKVRINIQRAKKGEF